MLAVLSLTAMFLVTSLAVGQTGTTRTSTSSKVSPKRDKKRPYKFKTTGSIRLPATLCAPNVRGRNCVPIICPPGVRDARYCTRLPRSRLCTGSVRIVFKKGARTVSSKTARLKANCKYSSRATVRSKGRLKVSASFRGNVVLAPSKASRKSARAG